MYLILGPAAWLSLLAGFALANSRMNRLKRAAPPLPENPPLVTILIPAKDEAQRIAGCIERIMAQDYPNFQIIVVDDRSTDRTGVILDEIAAKTERLRVVHIEPGDLPPGWLGKCHALAKAEKLVAGSWLLFVDSDVSLQPDALSRSLAVGIQRNYDALSILTRLECHTFLERLILPIAAAAWAVMNLASATNDDESQVAVANGQFFLIRREAYEKVGGHEAVRNQITEDVELMRLLKGAGFITRLQFGEHLASTRMHSNLGQMFHGWGRIYSGTNRRSPWRILTAMTFLIICGLSVYPVLAFGITQMIAHRENPFLIGSIAHLLLLSAYLTLVYHTAGVAKRYVWLFPLAVAFMLPIFGFALRMCRTGRLQWRGTQYAAETLTR